MAFAELVIDAFEVDDIARMFERAGSRAPEAVRLALNRTGDQTWTQVVRTLAKQTGLKQRVTRKAVKRKRASAGRLAYVLSSRGGDIALKYFGARETRKGVSAAPGGQRRIFPGTFIRGGNFPRRVPLAMNGHVFMRLRRRRFPIVKQRSGIFIPKEMVSGETKKAFDIAVRTILPVRLRHEFGRLLST